MKKTRTVEVRLALEEDAELLYCPAAVAAATRSVERRAASMKDFLEYRIEEEEGIEQPFLLCARALLLNPRCWRG